MAAVSAFILRADGNREGPSTRDLRAEVFTQPRPVWDICCGPDLGPLGITNRKKALVGTSTKLEFMWRRSLRSCVDIKLCGGAVWLTASTFQRGQHAEGLHEDAGNWRDGGRRRGGAGALRG